MGALSDLFSKLEELTKHMLNHMTLLWAELECVLEVCHYQYVHMYESLDSQVIIYGAHALLGSPGFSWSCIVKKKQSHNNVVFLLARLLDYSYV